ncbi:glycerol-3-phosphate dehydrogenase, mitochondrial-like isoform X2 [Larimichthys crocea]|uniref:glycerol-3-phosphate dehydrogenase, mitochondrial-like isoform X2 n=1 Tax=Larimichthys crocea TaxID=215358 RepID=UPI000F600999|nr:glycerol-3-phosphate dehydrogenase, mitochondrial-like isoform X2 [Larimichthys crocea]
MNLAIALTAARYGAAIANYTEVVHLLKRADPQTGKERVYGAHCRDVITGQEFDVRAKCVINATGPFTDALRKMDDQKNPDICQPSAGVHIVILGYYSLDEHGAPGSRHVISLLGKDAQIHPHGARDPDGSQRLSSCLSRDIGDRRGDVSAPWSVFCPRVIKPNSKDAVNLQEQCRHQ